MSNLDAHAGAIAAVTAQFNSRVTIDRTANAIIVMPGGSLNIKLSGALIDASSPAYTANKVLVVVNDIVHGRDPTPDLMPGLELVTAT